MREKVNMRETKLMKLMKKNNFNEKQQVIFEQILKYAKLQYDGSQEDVKSFIKNKIDEVAGYED